jgi:hypothetical protein
MLQTKFIHPLVHLKVFLFLAVAAPKSCQSNLYVQFDKKIHLRMLQTKFGDHPSITSVKGDV